MIRNLNGKWIMRRADNLNEYFETEIPASVYDTLIKVGRIPDPYFGENQYEAFEVSKSDYIFESRLPLPYVLPIFPREL